jgi:hypothetical protein
MIWIPPGKKRMFPNADPAASLGLLEEKPIFLLAKKGIFISCDHFMFINYNFRKLPCVWIMSHGFI